MRISPTFWFPLSFCTGFQPCLLLCCHCWFLDNVPCESLGNWHSDSPRYQNPRAFKSLSRPFICLDSASMDSTNPGSHHCWLNWRHEPIDTEEWLYKWEAFLSPHTTAHYLFYSVRFSPWPGICFFNGLCPCLYRFFGKRSNPSLNPV